MSMTKKMPSSLGKDGQPGRGSEFVIPHPNFSEDGGFFGIKSGKTHPKAAMTFIGRSITVDDVIEKIQKPIADPKKTRKQIEEFLGQLQDFKIGNVISISYEADGAFTLNLEATRPPSQNRKSLP
tara:strand:+ start:563 stop:937 length:375 start_codon:yes stop_codon:yes gene_type:complete